MDILAVTWGFPRRDQPFLITRFRLLAERGHRVGVLCAPGDTDLDPDLADQVRGVEIYPILREGGRRRPDQLLRAVVGAGTDPRFTLEAIGALYRRGGANLVRRRLVDAAAPFAGRHPDVVHFEFANWAAAFTEVLPLLRCPVVVTCHGSDVAVHPLHDRGLRDRLPMLFEQVQRVVCVSGDLAAAAVGFGLDRRKVAVIPMGVDTRRFSPPPRPQQAPGTPTRLLSVGRLHWVKGYEYALQAVVRLRARGYPVTYTIVGEDGGGGESLRLARRALGLEDEVTLAGFVPQRDVRSLLAETDIFVLPSLSEGVSTAALEAMATGVAVVSTGVGGMPDVIEHGRSGMLVPSRDPVELADAIEALVADPELHQELAAAGLDRVRRHFDATQQTDEVVALYEEAIGEQGERRGHAPTTRT